MPRSGAESGFAAERVWRGLEGRGLLADIPPQPTMLPKDDQPSSAAQEQAVAAPARCKSKQGIWAHKRRVADAEGVIGELKHQHALERVRSRGTPLFHIQLLLRCLRSTASASPRTSPEAASGVAGAPLSASGEPRPAATGACRVDRGLQGPLGQQVGRAPATSPSAWGYVVCLS